MNRFVFLLLVGLSSAVLWAQNPIVPDDLSDRLQAVEKIHADAAQELESKQAAMVAEHREVEPYPTALANKVRLEALVQDARIHRSSDLDIISQQWIAAKGLMVKLDKEIAQKVNDQLATERQYVATLKLDAQRIRREVDALNAEAVQYAQTATLLGLASGRTDTKDDLAVFIDRFGAPDLTKDNAEKTPATRQVVYKKENLRIDYRDGGIEKGKPHWELVAFRNNTTEGILPPGNVINMMRYRDKTIPPITAAPPRRTTGVGAVPASTTVTEAANTTGTGTRSTSVSGGSSVRCAGTTQKGAQCKRMTTSSSGRCYQH